MPLFVPLHTRREYPPAYPPVYHHRGRWPPPIPNLSLPRSPYPLVHVRHPPSTGALSPSRHRGRRDRQDRSGSRGPRRRYVRFTDQPVIIELVASPPQAKNPPSQAQAAPAPTRGCLRRGTSPRRTPASPETAPTASQPAATAAAAPSLQASPAPVRLLINLLRHPQPPPPSAATPTSTEFGLHALLASFPPGLWDLRRTTRPPYHPQHEPRLAEPAFPLAAHKRKRSMTLQFRPCADLAWSATVTAKAAGCATRLTVGDVLRAVSAELFARSACGALRAGASGVERAGAGEGEGERAGTSIKPIDLFSSYLREWFNLYSSY